MSDLLKIIDAKFGAAFELYAAGNNAIHIGKPVVVGPDTEIIALDSAKGPASRCLLTRYCLGQSGMEIDGLDISSQGLEIPRAAGDTRCFEDLPAEAIQGRLFAIGIKDGEVVVEGYAQPDWLNVDGLCLALSGMRVAKSFSMLHS
jgi:hypothetical protein